MVAEELRDLQPVTAAQARYTTFVEAEKRRAAHAQKLFKKDPQLAMFDGMTQGIAGIHASMDQGFGKLLAELQTMTRQNQAFLDYQMARDSDSGGSA